MQNFLDLAGACPLSRVSNLSVLKEGTLNPESYAFENSDVNVYFLLELIY